MANLMELDKRINAFNKLAEAACAIAQSLEREAWEHCDHGFTPTSAAELLTPAILEQLPPATPEQPQPVPEFVEEESAPQVVDLVEVRTALSKASQAGHTDQVRALIQQAGASKLSEVDPAKYAWLLGKVQELSS
ncbi:MULTISPECIES: hypothetical protein [unclassified Corynebacterium]|uniref:hypothetical protein n=1 Tax=unclassified Corynebacterium TaxID=2624378 RepID=UPI00211C6732|nr:MULTISPECIES: hypothetical protein [unclassified Corynebacterium]MCQ9359260.1 hypothetical protein [Corynebacterium sp. 142RC1]MCQ9365401.1 hypothetical protein [Corynebacterium sp. 70RC1]